MSAYSLRKRKKAPIVELSEEEIEQVEEEPSPRKKKAAPKEASGGRRGRKKKGDTESPTEEKKASTEESKETTETPAKDVPSESKVSDEEEKPKEKTEEKPSEETASRDGAEPPKASETSTETAATTSDTKKHTKLLEHGHIFFFYRPKVGVESASGIEDVQRLYIVLSPEGSPKKRVLVLPKKMLPDIKGHDRYFAFVDMVTEKWEESLEPELGSADYKTKTRGARHLEGARPCGAGAYGLVKHEAGHTHLAFVLELPTDMGEVQEAFDIPKEGSYVITIKNPQKEGAIKMSGKHVELPSELQAKFEDKKFIGVDPPQLLDHEGMELILIGAKEDIVAELGGPGEEERIEAKKLSDDAVFKELHLRHKGHPAQALFSGDWK